MLILASASPRRKELLKTITPNFETVVSEINEDLPSNTNVMDAAEYLATKKALDVSKRFPNDIVIGADTIIVFNNKIYGKPQNKNEAKEMLKSFSGNTHLVITGVSIVNGSKSMSFSSISSVEFYTLTDQEIDEYLENDEYKDKAGSYAIQGKGTLFIKEIKGDYNSIVGLPVSKLNHILKNFFNF
jgi:septum formation protein